MSGFAAGKSLAHRFAHRPVDKRWSMVQAAVNRPMRLRCGWRGFSTQPACGHASLETGVGRGRRFFHGLPDGAARSRPSSSRLIAALIAV